MSGTRAFATVTSAILFASLMTVHAAQAAEPFPMTAASHTFGFGPISGLALLRNVPPVAGVEPVHVRLAAPAEADQHPTPAPSAAKSTTQRPTM